MKLCKNVSKARKLLRNQMNFAKLRCIKVAVAILHKNKERITKLYKDRAKLLKNGSKLAKSPRKKTTKNNYSQKNNEKNMNDFVQFNIFDRDNFNIFKISITLILKY